MDFFFKLTFSRKSFRNKIRVSNGLDPDKARHFVGPYLGPNCLQRLSADDNSCHLWGKRDTPTYQWDVHILGKVLLRIWCPNILCLPLSGQIQQMANRYFLIFQKKIKKISFDISCKLSS